MTDPAMTPEQIAEIKAGHAAWQKALKSDDTDEWHFTATALAERIPELLAHIKVLTDEIERLRYNISTGRMTSDISKDLRERAGEPLGPLAIEAADQLDELITLLAKAETARDEALDRTDGEAWDRVTRQLAEARQALDHQRERFERELAQTRVNWNAEARRFADEIEAQVAAARYHRCSGCGAIGPLRHEGSSYICADCNSAPIESPAAPTPLVEWYLDSVRLDARAEGYAAAVAMLRDDDRYTNWWTKLPQQDPAYGYWQQPARRHLADYIETIGLPAAPSVDGGEALSRRSPAAQEALDA